MGKLTLARFSVVLSGVLWGLSGVFSRRLNEFGFSSFQIGLARCFIACLVLFFIIVIKNKAVPKIDLKDIWIFLGTGVLSVGAFSALYFMSTELNPLSIAAILLYTAPFFVVIFSKFIFGERIGALKLASLVLAFVGCALASGILGVSQGISAFGISVGVGAGLAYSLYSIFGAIAVKKYDSSTVTFYTFLFASIALAPFANLVDFVPALFSNGAALWNAILIAVVSALLPYLIYTKALVLVEAGRAAILTFSEPMAASIYGLILFGEKIALQGFIGIIMIFVALVAMNVKVGKGKNKLPKPDKWV